MSLRKYERKVSPCAIFWVNSSDYILVHYFSLVSDSLTTFFITDFPIWHSQGNMAGWFFTFTSTSSKKPLNQVAEGFFFLFKENH